MIFIRKNIESSDLKGKSIILLNQNGTYVQCDSWMMVKSHLEINKKKFNQRFTYKRP